MVPITEPVTSCTIIFKYLYWTPDRKDKRYYHDRFPTILDLKQYFKRFPAAGALVGYGKAPTGQEFAFEGELLMEWTDKVSTVLKNFSDVHDFVNFLKDHPILATCVGYQPKGKEE